MEQDRWEQDREPAVEWAVQERDKDAVLRQGSGQDADAWADLVSAAAETVYVPLAVKKCRISRASPARS